jgi:hypothetical protein
MRVIRYKDKESVLKKALEIGLNESNLFDCHVSYSFRIFQNKTTKELHIYYK